MADQVQIHFSPDTEHQAEWIVTSMKFVERFNQPYELRLVLRTDDLSAEPATMLGTRVSLELARGEMHRELFGVVGDVEDGTVGEDYVAATVTIVPALAALAHRRNSRFFSDKSVKEVLIEVLSEGLAPYDREVDASFLHAEYPTRQHITQYRESDLDFVHRLMEEHGVTYRFDHRDGAELMVLLDNDSAYTSLTSLGSADGVLPMARTDGGSDDREDLRHFARKSMTQPTVARGAAFDWRNPSVEALEAALSKSGQPELEDYDFRIPPAGLGIEEVERRVQLRGRYLRRGEQTFSGVTTATQLRPGAKFELIDHPRGDLNGAYLVTSVEHAAGDLAVPSDPATAYNNRFECIPLGVPWCPTPKTPRPQISGVQTATVVGDGEIDVDAHGRVKVEFHWDRDQGASCFIPVVQPWAGKGWGTMFYPRVGMQVVVSFLDGDPDQPVVTGTLYNGTNTPPYGLPGEQTKSGIKTQSSPGGGGFNELRFEDAANSEEIYIHAQRDFRREVLNDQAETIGGHQTIQVAKDRTMEVEGTCTVTTGNQVDRTLGHRTETTHLDREQIVRGNSFEVVDGLRRRTLNGAVEETITGGEIRTVTGGVVETINGGEDRTINGRQTEEVNGDTVCTRAGNYKDTASGGYLFNAGRGGFEIRSRGAVKVTAPGGMVIVDPKKSTQTLSVMDLIVGIGTSFHKQKRSSVGTSFSHCLMSFSATYLKLDVTGIKIASAKVKWTDSSLKVTDGVTEISNVATSICNSILTVIG